MITRHQRNWSLMLALVMLLVQVIQPLPTYADNQADDGWIRGTFEYAGMYNMTKDSEMDFVYSDAYFEGDARVYNPSLSTMSLALEISCWSSLDEDAWELEVLVENLGCEGYSLFS